MQQVLKIDIDKILQSPYQGRLIEFGITQTDESNNTLNSLAQNIEQNGLLVPIIVRGVDDGYELIDGHRRLEACRLLKRTTIEAIVREADDRNAQVMSVVSNLQREDLYNVERALAFRKILDAGVFKDQKELSQAIGKDQTYVGDLLNTLNMDKRIIDDLLKNKTTNDVRLLRAIRRSAKTNEEGYSDEQWNLYQRFVNEGLTRKEVLALSNEEKNRTVKDLKVVFKPRRIEVELPKKYTLEQRNVLTEMLKQKIEEILAMGES